MITKQMDRDLRLYYERMIALDKLRYFLTPEEFHRIEDEIGFWLELHLEDNQTNKGE